MSLYHLDADWLIALAEKFHDHNRKARDTVVELLAGGDRIAASAVAWSEFSTGKRAIRSVDDIMRCDCFLNGGIFSLGKREAQKAAELFNQIGRPRPKKWRRDCLIAACAIVGGAELATFNIRDFKKFVPFGLQILGLTTLQLDTEKGTQLEWGEQQTA